jgi:hypothetical protein
MLFFVQLDHDIYCGVCLKIVTAPERPTLITDTTIIMGSGDADTKDSCPRCGGKVNDEGRRSSPRYTQIIFIDHRKKS